MDSADRSSYLLDAVVHGHYRQVKFYLDAGYDKDYIDNDREGKKKHFLDLLMLLFYKPLNSFQEVLPSY